MATEQMDAQVLVRMPRTLHDRLRRSAKANHRSVPGEVRYVVEQHLKAVGK